MENHYNCIYMYTNKVNEKKYVGQTVDFNKRYKQHIYGAYNENSGYHYNVPFHCAIRKYGIENFEIEILKENLKDYEEMDYWERYYIKEFDTLANNKKGYNVSDGGGNGNTYAGKTDEEMKEIIKKRNETMNNKSDEEREEIKKKISENHANFKGEKHPMYGKHHSEETRQKISEANKGKIMSEESCRKKSETWNNKTDEEIKEWKRKKSEAWNNKSDEEREEIKKKISEATKGENNPMYGKHHSEETRQKMREAKTEECRKKISETRKNKGLSKGSKNPSAKKVIQIDPLTKQPVFIWQYKKQATEFYNFSHTLLDYYLKGKRKTGHEYNGFLWYYLDEWEQLTK